MTRQYYTRTEQRGPALFLSGGNANTLREHLTTLERHSSFLSVGQARAQYLFFILPTSLEDMVGCISEVSSFAPIWIAGHWAGWMEQVKETTPTQ